MRSSKVSQIEEIQHFSDLLRSLEVVWQMVLVHRVAPRLLLSGRVIRKFSSNLSQPPSTSPVSTPAPQRSPESSLSLDFALEKGSESTQSTGAKSSKHSLSSIERRRRLFSRFTLGLFVFGIVAEAIYLGRDWEENELKEKRLVRWDFFSSNHV
jgi:hypothetical protein